MAKGFLNTLRTAGQIAAEGAPGIARRVFQNWGGSPRRRPYIPPGGAGSTPNYDSFGRIISYTPATTAPRRPAPRTTTGSTPPPERYGEDPERDYERQFNLQRHDTDGLLDFRPEGRRRRGGAGMEFMPRGLFGLFDREDDAPPTAPVTPASEKPLALTRGGIQRYRRPLFELPGRG